MPRLRNVAALPRWRSATSSVPEAGRNAARPGRRTTSASAAGASAADVTGMICTARLAVMRKVTLYAKVGGASEAKRLGPIHGSPARGRRFPGAGVDGK